VKARAKAPVKARAKAPVKKAAAPAPAKAPAQVTSAAPTAPAPATPAPGASSTPQSTKLAAAAKPVKSEKDDKAKKPKLVRDSFTIPKAEYLALDALKQRAAKAGTGVKKSELLRAGIKTLAAMDDKQFAAAIGAVPAIKTGRPAKT